eukprot:7913979-Prorocentrum_lima.AAC.1
MTSSLVGSEMCIRDSGAPVYLVQEHSLEPEDLDPEHETFLVQLEADLNPRNWLKGSACDGFNPFAAEQIDPYENI